MEESSLKDVKHCLNMGGCGSCTYADEKGMMTCRKLMKDVQAELERLNSFGKWIPCSERLPEKEGHFIVTTVSLSGNRETELGYFFEGKWQMVSDGSFDKYDDGEVVAWMPLPEVYDGE